MGVYFFVLSYVFLLGILLKSKKISSKVFVELSIIVLALVLGLRKVGTGIDTVIYLNIFDYIKKLSWGDFFSSGFFVEYNYNKVFTYMEVVEIGYAFLNKICSYIMTNNLFILFISFIECYLFGNFIKKNCSQHIFLAMLVFVCETFYMSSFNLFRQMFAISIAINSIQYFRDQKYKKGIGLIVLGTSMHLSCLCMLIMLPIIKLGEKTKKGKEFVLKMTCLSAAGLLVFTNILVVLISKLIPKYSAYVTGNFWDTSVGGTVILWILGSVICFKIYKKRNPIGFYEYISIEAFIIYLFLQILSLRLTMFDRVSLYFAWSYFFILPNSEVLLGRRNRQLVALLVILILVLKFISYATDPTMKYAFFWQ